MAKVELKMDKLSLDLSVLSPKRFQDIALDEVAQTIGNTIDKLGRGQNVDGGAAKQGGYSDSYKKAIARGGGKGRGALSKKAGNTTPNLRVSGDLLESYVAKPIDGGAEGRFEGGHYSGMSNAALMGVQEGLGYKDVVAFGQDDEARIDKRFEEEVGIVAEQMVKLGRGTYSGSHPRGTQFVWRSSPGGDP